MGITVTVRVNLHTIKIFYNERLIAWHNREYKKNQVLTEERHRTGLLERKPGTNRQDWQVASVKSIGPQMQDYLELLRSGHRSLRQELSRILALSTIYGNTEVHIACEELLKAGIIGVEALELTLKRKHPASH